MSALLASPSACDSDSAGDTCRVNADCVDSQAAKDVANVRCGPKDIYCLNAECHAECRQLCEVVRDDVNPCSEPRQCARHGDSDDAVSYCTIVPIPCATVDDCPAYRLVLTDGGPEEWTCEDGVCRYPEMEYPTH